MLHRGRCRWAALGSILTLGSQNCLMPKPLPDELYHYTGIAGLKGIVESQTLWATHYKYLNDSEEIIHFRDRLPPLLRPVITKLLNGQNVDRNIVDLALKKDPETLAKTMYDVMFGDAEGDGISTAPFITSFCTVDKGDARVADHGLLSQWRGYGPQGGYAIIFDTERLIQLLLEEGKQWEYFVGLGGDVVYDSPNDEEMYAEFGGYIESIQRGWEKALSTGNDTALDTRAFVFCACRYKHWGFSEEKEFRFVSVPTAPKLIEMMKKDGKTPRPEKPVYNFLRNGTPVPYLNLFEGITDPSNKQLPIKRILVGPHPDKERRKLAVEILLRQKGIHADVSVSAIPYLGW